MGRIGIIGGSGLYELEGVKKLKEVKPSTPFGPVSAPLAICSFNGIECVFLPRHGRHHDLSPSDINYRANIYAMKKLNVGSILSVTACGSLKEEHKPLDFVIPTQFVDRTTGRQQSFFDSGIVAHISFGHPVCERLARIAQGAVQKAGARVHYSGTYLNIEGPQFSTLAESNLYRSWGMDIIGMTNMAEARLAREAEMCYATIAAVTDYDCWYQGQESVTAEIVLNNLRKNVEVSKKIVREFLLLASSSAQCSCHEALKYSIVTRPEHVSKEVKKKLDIIIGRYMK